MNISFSGIKFKDLRAKSDFDSLKSTPERAKLIDYELKYLGDIAGSDSVVLSTHSHDKKGFNISLRTEDTNKLLGYGYLSKFDNKRLIQKEFESMSDLLLSSLIKLRHRK